MATPCQRSDGHAQGSLGLRLRMADGQEAITTTTHVFVRLAYRGLPPLLKSVTDWYPQIRASLANCWPLRLLSTIPAVGEVRLGRENTPLGKKIWLAGTGLEVGTITRTYDPHPSECIPFPYGFKHDLSLITGPNLPQVTNPPGMPMIVGWGSYAAALDGGPLCVCRLNVITGKWRHIECRGMAKEVIALGSEYSWDREAASQNAALLWRTVDDVDPAVGFSGSVLCLGRPTDPTALALVLQNYEGDWDPGPARHDHRAEVRRGAIFKAGFLLPSEIRSSTIEMVHQMDFEPRSLIAAKRSSTSSGQRSVTGP
ncbi:MAG: hypothetical protein M1816_000241 [Peltula sp. TS41687]|nr:MAG: hypothetical protein M1816_000241 [Peltula sp. TS41687]